MVLGAISGHKQHTKSLGEFESRKVFFFQDGVQDGRHYHKVTIYPLLFMLES